MAIFLPILAIISIVASIYGVAENVVVGQARRAIQPLVTKLTKALETNTKLRNDLVEAYNNKNAKAMDQLLSTSPFSSTYISAMNEVKRINSEFENKKKQLDDIEKRTNQSRVPIEQMSTTSDLVSGSQHLNSINKGNHKNQIASIENDINKLVQGGVSQIDDVQLDTGPQVIKGSNNG